MEKRKDENVRISPEIMDEVRKRKAKTEKELGVPITLKHMTESLIGDGLDKK